MKMISILMVLCLSFTVSCGEEKSISSSVQGAGVEVLWRQSFTSFTDFFRLVTDFKQLKRGFDFNGDGSDDYLYFVEVKNAIEKLPDVVRIYQLESDKEHSRSLSGGYRALVIYHGGSQEKIVLHEQKAMPVIDAPAALDLFVVEKVNLSASEVVDIASHAKGDVIVLPTSAGIDTYIYFDGEKYRLYEPLEVP